MFGISSGHKRSVRKLRRNFEQIVAHVTYRMNPYEQYSFGTVFDHIPADLTEPFRKIPNDDRKSWLKFSSQLQQVAWQGYLEQKRLGGMAGDGGMAGAEDLMLMSLEAATYAYPIPEADVLRKDIVAFRISVNEFVTNPNYEAEPLPQRLFSPKNE